MRIDSLTLTDSPRLGGENPEHTRRLAAADDELPPILVHRSTRWVIDGAHRVRAAALRGQTGIAARFFDGPMDAAFVLAVRGNIAHGLPLSTADRRAAAARIVRSHPYWSDRAIAAATGLSDKTVRAIRRSTSEQPQSNAGERVGIDGRTRPLNSADGRRRAAQLLAERPGAGLREIASAAGISLATAHDVRARLLRDEDPVPARLRSPASAEPVVAEPVRLAVLDSLRQDPSLKFNEAGRAALRWLYQHTIEPDDGTKLINTIPPHCATVVADLARDCAQAWQALARQLEQRGKAAG
ncbi:MAG TPA: streptomycin biosynthesis protein [Pseudonocardiaceae bacterium]|nr:streptomycin biosynthesis protein [Pseudonocardiaceae bacterium]